MGFDRAPQVQVRRCTAQDAAVLAQVCAETFQDTFAADNTAKDMEVFLAESYSPQVLAAALADPESSYWLATVDGIPAAYLKTNVGKAQTEPVEGRISQPSLEVQRIYVRLPYKRRGLGARLMGGALDEARAHAAASIWLGVWERNTAALAFYERLGFTRFGEHVFQVGSDAQTDYLMVCPVERLAMV